MTWLAWRQFRANAAIAAVLTLAIVVVLAVTHSHVAHVLDTGKLPPGYKSLRLLGTVLIGVPAFIGAFWGAPLVARELETGTHQLAWTQSVTRTRWLVTKLAVIACAAIVATGVFSLMLTWWSSGLDQVGNRIGTANFGQRGIVPIAYALFALALGAFAGTVLRRTLPAMAATLVGFGVVRYLVQLWVRPGLLPTVTSTVPNNLFGQHVGDTPTSGGWILTRTTVDAAGHAVSDADIDRIIRHSCHVTRGTTPGDLGRCADRVGLRDVVRMHPGNQFWSMQGWEAAIFVGLAVTLLVACVWWLRHRVG